jgi:hypothetical protein
MSSTYSTNLALELIGTGDQAGTWGNTTNTNLGTLIEQAISGYVTQAVSTGTDTTITIPNGATGVARNMYIELTGTGGASTNLIVPANKKLYFIFNNASGAVTVKVSGQTGVSVPAGKKVVLASNGTDTVNALNYIADFGSNSATITQLTATSATITNLTLTSLVISNLSIASANITTLTSSSATISTTLALSGGTANGVLYLNGSKVATSGSALTFNGTNTFTVIPATGTAYNRTESTQYSTWMQTGAGNANVFWEFSAGTPVRWVDTSAGELMRLTSTSLYTASGINVGIGTSSPSVKLHIVGGARIQDSTSASNYITIGSGNEAPYGNNSIVAQTGSFNIGTVAASTSLFLITAGTSKATLDTSGNLGLGVTPSLWRSTEKAIQIGSWMGLFTDSGITTEVSYNNYINSSNQRIYQNTGYALRYQQYNGIHSWHTAPSGTAGNQITGANAFNQMMTLDASGRLLVGQTVDKTQEVLRVSGSGQASLLLDNTGKTNGAFVGAFNDAALLCVNRNPSTGVFYNTSNRATDIALVGSATDSYIIFETSTAANTTPTERARITSDGKLLVNATATATVLNKTIELSSAGTSTDQPSYLVNSYVAAGNAENCGYFTFNRSAGSNVGTNTLVANDDRLGMVRFSGANGTSYNAAAEIYAEIDGTPGASSDMPGRLIFATTPNGSASTTERARITSGGFFKASNTGTYSSSTNDRYEFTSDKNDLTILVNSTNTGANVNNVYSQLPAGANAGAYHFVGSISGSGLQFTVDADGDVKNTNNSYGSISDIKLKQDVVDAASQWDDIKALRVRKYRFKRNPDAALQIGLVAQEAEAVSPGLVEETADRDEEGDDLGTTTKSVKYSVLYMKAVKALQEAMTRIEQLEAKVAALESK